MKKTAILSIILLLTIVVKSQLIQKTESRESRSGRSIKNNRNFSDSSNININPQSFYESGRYNMKPDNMVCVVPDMKSVSSMPNGFTGRSAVPFIPNSIPGKPGPKFKRNK